MKASGALTRVLQGVRDLDGLLLQFLATLDIVTLFDGAKVDLVQRGVGNAVFEEALEVYVAIATAALLGRTGEGGGSRVKIDVLLLLGVHHYLQFEFLNYILFCILQLLLHMLFKLDSNSILNELLLV